MSSWSPFFLSASSKTISGLLEFDSKTEAVEVLTVLNHYQIRIPSRLMEPLTPGLLTPFHTFSGGKVGAFPNKFSSEKGRKAEEQLPFVFLF